MAIRQSLCKIITAYMFFFGLIISSPRLWMCIYMKLNSKSNFAKRRSVMVESQKPYRLSYI